MQKTLIPRGEEEWIYGSSWSSNKPVGTFHKPTGLYQCETSVFWKLKSLVFDVAEFDAIRGRVNRIEVVKNDKLLYSVSGSVAEAEGREALTPNGQRWAIPLGVCEAHV